MAIQPPPQTAPPLRKDGIFERVWQDWFDVLARIASPSVVSKTFADTGYVSSASQTVLVNATAGATTIKLPVQPLNGIMVTVKKTDASANAVTVSGNGVNIDAAATQALAAQFNSFILQADGSAWQIVGKV